MQSNGLVWIYILSVQVIGKEDEHEWTGCICSHSASLVQTCGILKDVGPAKAECLRHFIQCQPLVQFICFLVADLVRASESNILDKVEWQELVNANIPVTIMIDDILVSSNLSTNSLEKWLPYFPATALALSKGLVEVLLLVYCFWSFSPQTPSFNLYSFITSESHDPYCVEVTSNTISCIDNLEMWHCVWYSMPVKQYKRNILDIINFVTSVLMFMVRTTCKTLLFVRTTNMSLF
jgi:hypothetical protein